MYMHGKNEFLQKMEKCTEIIDELVCAGDRFAHMEVLAKKEPKK